jgi:hypothetical protein
MPNFMKGIHIFLFSIVGCAMHGHSQEGTKQNFVYYKQCKVGDSGHMAL